MEDPRKDRISVDGEALGIDDKTHRCYESLCACCVHCLGTEERLFPVLGISGRGSVSTVGRQGLHDRTGSVVLRPLDRRLQVREAPLVLFPGKVCQHHTLGEQGGLDAQAVGDAQFVPHAQTVVLLWDGKLIQARCAVCYIASHRGCDSFCSH
jgi:hypothetical protein